MIPMDNTHTTDASLLGRMAQGDPQALAVFYARHARPVFSLALAMLGDQTRAGDLTYEVFLLVWRSAGVSPPGASARAWVLRLTRNLAIDELLRAHRSLQGAPTLPDQVVQALPALPDLADTAVCQTLRDALAALPAAQREALLLAFFHGLSHQEIATRLQTSLGTIKACIRRALQTLCTQFQKGGTP
jgi:RNA polymerase sigma-70 factor (ECF subfamily)